jgi:peptidoglycan/xylan/chitin deacetylase (PgdA/CDA1 family)
MNQVILAIPRLLLILGTALALCGCRSSADPGLHSSISASEVRLGALIRGPTAHKRIALVFTGHEFAEGAGVILDELARHRGAASFFLTGTFLTNTAFTSVLQRMIAEGHYIGPHSDRHLLYCEWNPARTTRVTRDDFTGDLRDNVAKLAARGANPHGDARYFLPPFEHYNAEIASWSASLGWSLINFTPGTRSNADYTGEADANFVSSDTIFNSILGREREDPHGLNGFLLLLHLGSGPGRSDKFHVRFGELLDHLAEKGYRFVRVDVLLANCEETTRD